MKYLLKAILFTISFFITSVTCTSVVAQMPCDPTDCCLDNEGFEEFPLGPFQTSLPFQTAGFYAESGNVTVVGEGHLDAQSISLIATTSTLAYGAGGGVAGINPVFAVDNEYCIELCLFVATDHGPINLEISTENGVIYTSPSYTFSGSWVTISLPTYFASIDHYDLYFNIIGTPETVVLLDNICIDILESVECMADFELESISECGEYCFINKSCGEALTYNWSIRNASNVEIHSAQTEDLCFTFLIPGNYTVVLTVSDGMDCEDETDEKIEVDFDPFEFNCDFGETIVVAGGIDCTYDYAIPNLIWSGGTFPPSITVFVNGIPSSEGAVLTLIEGTNTIFYNITNECGLETDCIYTVIVECQQEIPEICGQAMITCFPGQNNGTVNTTSPVLGRVDVRDRSSVLPGYWSAQSGTNIYHPAHWNSTNLGLPFGIAIDNADNVYVTASTAYGCPSSVTIFGPAGASGIYKIDPSDNISNFVVTGTFNSSGTDNMIPNGGGSLGNICYSQIHDLLYVTNLSDGKIYTINSSGQVLSDFDPFIPTSPGVFAPLGDRPWGIAYNPLDNRLYFSNWVEDVARVDNTRRNEIWSVALDASGMIVGSDNIEFGIPDTLSAYTSPISDIAFSNNGRMLISEKSMGGDCGGAFVRNTQWAHKSKVWEFEYNTGTAQWQLTPGHVDPYSNSTQVKFSIGKPSGNIANSSGGIDYGYNSMTNNNPLICDDMIWASADIMQDVNLPVGPANRWYGIQGTPSSGGSNNNSYLVDFDGVSGYSGKYNQGDVEVFKCGCPAESSICDSLMVMSHPTPTECVDSSIITGFPCTFEFDPVCGCDGQTYSNACVAGESGITTYTPGECNGDNTPLVPEGCCYIIDIKNNYGPSIVELEVEMLTPEWIFNSTSLSAPFTFGSCGSLNHLFCVEDATSGMIPSGNSFGAISTCFVPVVINPTTQPIVEFRWKELIGNEEVIVTCRDTMEFFCNFPPMDTCLVIEDDTIRCLGGDNPLVYEYCFTLTNKSGQPVSQIVLDDLTPGFTFLPGNVLSKIVNPIPNALPDQATSAQICVQVESSIPITTPGTFCLKMGLVAVDGSDCCHSPVEICKEIEPCCNPCDDKSITFNSINMNEDDCCYSVDIINECAMPYFTKIEAIINTPGVCFGSHVIGSSHTTNWNVSSTPQSICMTPLGGVIDQPSYQDLFSFCLDKIDDPSQANPSITINWYAIDPITGQQTVVCEDLFETECPSGDNTCVIISEGDIICVPDSNKYRYTFKVKNISQPGFIADRLHLTVKNDPSWQPVPSGPVIVLNPPLGSGDSTIITTCIQGPAFPAPFSDFIFGYRLQNLQDGDCCFESKCDTIPVPPCTDCCDEERLDQELDDYLNTLLVDGCKISLGPIEPDSCVGMTINWGDSTGDHYHIDSLTCKIYDQAGTYNVCVQWEVYPEMGIFPCYLKDTCFNVEVLECPSDCFTVIDIETKNVICDSIDCYEQPFCLPWLVAEIGNVTCTGFNDPYFEKAMYSGMPVIIKWQPTMEGPSHTIYDCSGTIIQSCTPTGGGGLACFPDASIDVDNDLTAMVTIWSCGDAIPTVDPSCPIGKSVEYCVKLMNNNPNNATQVQLNPILPPGINITPNVIPVNIPSGGMSTITFTLSGPLMTGIDTKIDAILSGTDAMGIEWSCSDTLCLPTPPCPPLEECCQDKDIFDTLVAQGLQITDLGDCTYQVCANQFTDCHWFWTASPDWGDGTIVLPVLTQSNAPNNCWTHTYSTAGSYTITLNVEEQNANGEACWNGKMQAQVECDFDESGCANITEEEYCSIFDEVLDYTIEECNTICWSASDHPCDFVQIDFGDGTNSGTITNGETVCHNYSSDGVFLACVKIFRIDNISEDTCIVKEECVDIVIDCFPPICVDCPDGSTPGPNQIINGDFESGNVNFSSGHTFVPSPLPMVSGQYGVRNNTTMGNWFWDNSANTSLFLQVDAQSNTVMWSQNVNVIQGETYIFCAELDNLVDPLKLTETTSPTVSIRIDGTVIPGLSNIPINQIPDAVQVISNSWFCPTSGSFTLDIFMENAGTYGDVAIDNISFRQCGGCDIGGDPCDQIDLEVTDQEDSCCFDVTFDNQYCDNYFKGFMVTTVAPNTVSQIQAKTGWYINQITPYLAEVFPFGTFPLGTGSAFVICGDNTVSNTLDFTVSWLLPTPAGCEAICEENFSRECPDSSSCITIIDDIIDCNQYCFRVTNNTFPGFTINSIVLDQLTPAGTILNPNPISIPSLAPGATSSIICLDYTNLLPGDTFCYNVVAHDVDITNGEIPTWCCTDPIAKCATVPDDCSPCNDLSVITSNSSQGDTCCWSVDIVNGYHPASFVGIRAKVLTGGVYFANINTTPDWSLDFLAANEYIFNYDDGTGFIPLGNNITGDFCLTGYTTGLQQVEFSWLQVDPMTGDTIDVCPVVIDSDCAPPPPPLPCSDISDVMIDCVDDMGNYNMTFNLFNNTHLFGSGYNALSFSLSNLTTTGSMVVSPIHKNLSPILMPGQNVQEMINISGTSPGDSLCFSITLHDQLVGGGFNNCCTADTIWCFVIPDCSDCCDDYNLGSLTQDVDLAINNYIQDNCEICFNGEFPDCVNWYVDWGDGSSPIGTSVGNDTRCLTYNEPSTFTACLYAWVLDMNGDTCLSYDQCIDVNPCDDFICCDISDEAYDELFEGILDYYLGDTCNVVCFDLDGEVCDSVVINYGDGTVVGLIPANSDEQCHEYTAEGIYDVCIKMYRRDDEDSTINCMERDTCIAVSISCDPDGCCDEYILDQLNNDLSDVISTATGSENCDATVTMTFPDCVEWKVDWGDGSSDIGIANNQVLTHNYQVDSMYNVCVTGTIYNVIDSICLTATMCTIIDVSGCATRPECDPTTWNIPNGLTPNGDGLNESLKFYNTEECSIDFKVYNRWGQMVYNKRDYISEWHGQSDNGELLPDGTYYLLIGTDSKRDGSFDNYITRYIDVRRE